MNIPLSSDQVVEALNGKVNFLTYTELSKYNNIHDALGPYKKLILLYLTTKNYGHYVCLFINNKGHLHFFDSYGKMPDDQLKFIPEYFRDESDQRMPHLTYLLWKAHNPVYYNEFRLQKMNKNVATCGRWCVARLSNIHLSEKQFANYFLNKKTSPDNIVLELTDFIK